MQGIGPSYHKRYDEFVQRVLRGGHDGDVAATVVGAILEGTVV